ncbi:hypothetical protein WDZ16_12845 [Pseudokineococcus marinus]|uniref:Uncharacterized protein n=1 Tax=Pseudokineococcus marinus TaxID=351215 RepID=A0A849BLE5_9ACTN|nr:hypothetical protein [Pseudokineococcus marinus]NNH21622.1 hypothetical protein [Pseudokineococcus marinus]
MLIQVVKLLVWPAAVFGSVVLGLPRLGEAIAGQETDVAFHLETGLGLSLGINVFLGGGLLASERLRRRAEGRLSASVQPPGRAH